MNGEPLSTSPGPARFDRLLTVVIVGVLLAWMLCAILSGCAGFRVTGSLIVPTGGDGKAILSTDGKTLNAELRAPRVWINGDLRLPSLP